MLLRIAAVAFPPLVVLSIGSKREWYLNLALTACAYLPGSVHALYLACAYQTRRMRAHID